jgi:hypothetical protein
MPQRTALSHFLTSVQLFAVSYFVLRETNTSAVLHGGRCYSCLPHMYGYLNCFPVIHGQLGTRAFHY